MKQLPKVFILIACVYSQIMAQETDLKKVYTDVTTQINSALLTRKGAFELTGSVFYERFKEKYDDYFRNTEFITETFQVDAGLGHFFFNNISLGVLLSYFNMKQSFTERSIEQTMVGPAIKLYFGEKRWRPYLSADYLFLTGDSWDGGEADFGAGLLYHATGNFALSLQIKYGILFADEDHLEGLNRLFVGIGIVNFIL